MCKCVCLCVCVAMKWFSFLTPFQRPQVPLAFPFIPPSSLPSLFSSRPLFFFFTPHVPLFSRRTFIQSSPSNVHTVKVSSSLSLFPVFLPFQPMRKEPEVVTVTLKKHNGMGLSIVAAKVGNNTWKCVSFFLCVNFG